jgi:hypothetical protein
MIPAGWARSDRRSHPHLAWEAIARAHEGSIVLNNRTDWSYSAAYPCAAMFQPHRCPARARINHGSRKAENREWPETEEKRENEWARECLLQGVASCGL